MWYARCACSAQLFEECAPSRLSSLKLTEAMQDMGNLLAMTVQGRSLEAESAVARPVYLRNII